MTKHQLLSRRIATFARTRDWDHFRSPKNTALALGVEADEVLEHFLWLTQEESTALTAAKRLVVKEELADVFIYLVRLADVMGIDLYAAVESRMGDNERRYPVRKAGGRAGRGQACKA